MLTRGELHERISKLQTVIIANHCDAVLIIQNVDLYYYSGTMQNAQLSIPATGEPVLFCRKSSERAKQECPWPVIALPNYKLIPEKLLAAGLKLPKRLGLELDVIPTAAYFVCLKIFSNADIVDASNWIRNQRSIKSPYEIEFLRQGGEKMARVFSQVPQILRPGISELECAAEVERLARQLGHQGCIRIRGYNQELFFGHLLAGENGAIASFNDGATGGKGLGPFFPQGPSEKKIAVNEPIALDYVGVFDGYMVDQTRLFVIGSLPAKLCDAFQTALEIQEEIIALVKPGIMADELYNIALKRVENAGLSENFMGYGPGRAKFVGHGIGLEMDELPVLARGFHVPLEEGMVIALEPKFVFPGLGVVGIENTWLVTKTGKEKITDFPDDLVVIK
ncbi:MAG: Xaa-Pro peptidase family protein [Syntrophomonas sp.]